MQVRFGGFGGTCRPTYRFPVDGDVENPGAVTHGELTFPGGWVGLFCSLGD